MIDLVKQRLKDEMTDEERLNISREFIQLLCLKILDEAGAFRSMAFTGGTALRIVFGLKRFSEDLDFSLHKKSGRTFSEISEKLVKEIRLAGFDVSSRTKTDRTVQSSMLKFPGILKEILPGSSGKQNLSVKIEADTSPPPGGNVQSRFIRNIFLFNVVHYDLPSMFATKLHACFYRGFIKGRDFYDLIWYMSNNVKPSFTLLNNAVKQTEGKSPGISEKNFRKFLIERIETVNFENARRDVERFLEDKKELRLFDKSLIRQSIESVY